MVYDGPDDSGTGTNYCDSSVPSLVQSADSSLYIVYTSTDAGNSFKGAWEKVTSKEYCKYIFCFYMIFFKLSAVTVLC